MVDICCEAFQNNIITLSTSLTRLWFFECLVSSCCCIDQLQSVRFQPQNYILLKIPFPQWSSSDQTYKFWHCKQQTQADCGPEAEAFWRIFSMCSQGETSSEEFCTRAKDKTARKLLEGVLRLRKLFHRSQQKLTVLYSTVSQSKNTKTISAHEEMPINLKTCEQTHNLVKLFLIWTFRYKISMKILGTEGRGGGTRISSCGIWEIGE